MRKESIYNVLKKGNKLNDLFLVNVWKDNIHGIRTYWS